MQAAYLVVSYKKCLAGGHIQVVLIKETKKIHMTSLTYFRGRILHHCFVVNIQLVAPPWAVLGTMLSVFNGVNRLSWPVWVRNGTK
jgi:hypothetical protein